MSFFQFVTVHFPAKVFLESYSS
ncbi:hypothetical protein TYRP_022073 [Tyrophagus putrescentiae]|nr:hypothetical protein TYRP_022073 [Tyrophagus putrescentiae]